MFECSAQFQSRLLQPGHVRKTSMGSVKCAMSYSDADGFQKCRGLRQLGRCPRGHNYVKGEDDGLQSDEVHGTGALG